MRLGNDRQRLFVLIQNSIHWGIGGDRYTFDNREMLMSGDGLKLAATSLYDQLIYTPVDAIVCSGAGGVPLGAALKMLLPNRVKMCVVRDERKGRDRDRLVEGPALSLDDRIWVIDDLLNTGSSFDKIATALGEEYPGIRIHGTAVLVDFNAWGSKRLAVQGHVVRRVFSLDDFNLEVPKTTSGRVVPRWQNLHISSNPYEFFHSRPATAGNKLIVGTDNTEWVCCDKNTGEIIWTLASTRPSVKPVSAQPVIIGNRVIVTAYDGVVRCLDLDNGSVLWQNKLDSFIHSTPQVYGDRLYLGTEGRCRADHYGDLVCLDHHTGREHWRIKTSDMVPCTPLVLPEHDLVVCGSNDRHLYGVSLNGELKWRVKTDKLIRGKPVSANGMIFTAASEGDLEARDLRGGLIWSRCLGTSLHHGFPILHGDQIIVSIQESAIAAVDQKTGDVVWFNRQHATPAYEIVPHGDTGFCASRRGDLSKIDLKTGRTLWSERISTFGLVHQPVVFDPPMIYMISNTGGLAAFQLIE